MPAGTKQDTDPTFSSLPLRLRKRIDRALDAACADNNGPSRKRRKVASAPSSDLAEPVAGGFLVDEPTPGGFIVEDEDQQMGGGFIPEDPPSSDAGGFVPPSNSPSDEDGEAQRSHIPLSLIPQALQLLDLQPDDEDVLDVFRNAASGWGSTSGNLSHRATSDDDLFVSRKDWRAVCAALLDTSAQNEEGLEPHEDEEMVEEDVDESEASDDEYEGSGASSDENLAEDGSEDEYQEGGFVRSSARRKGKEKAKATSTARKSRSRKISYSSDFSEDPRETRPRQLTARQKAECRRTYALFFPDVPESELDTKRIMIKDITRVAGILKEKISVEEIVEMLEAFSTSPDKSMSLSDFETMMIAAKLA